MNGLGLRKKHPDAFAEAKAYEKNAVDHGSPFTWCQGESLADIEQPDRIQEIQIEHKRRVSRVQAKVQPNPLRPDNEPIDIDDLYGNSKACLACHK